MEIQKLTTLLLNRKVARQLAALFARKAWPKGMYPYEPLTKKSWWASEGKRLIADGSMISFVGFDNGRVVGHAAIVNHGWYWECGRWAVDPRTQGKGLGYKLVRSCVDFARQDSGIRWFVIGCSYYQSFSERICRDLGMTFLGINPDIYHRNGASWGETLFIWSAPGEKLPASISHEQLGLGVTGIWPDEFGLWRSIIPESLPRFVTKKPKGRLEGRVSVHTTKETVDFLF
jgi:RimJ/RimL family protein N-acetyltransferase